MKRPAFLVALLALASVSVGCRSIAPGRLRDLGDCGTFAIGQGIGFDASLELGCVAQPAVGVFHDMKYIGWNAFYHATEWSEEDLAWPFTAALVPVAAAFGNTDRLCAMPFVSWTGERSVRWQAENPPRTYRRSDGVWLPILFLPWEPTDGPRAEANPFAFHNATRLEGQLSLGVVSVRAGINPLEILDFLLGFLGFDIAGDDPPRGEKGDESHAENAESAE